MKTIKISNFRHQKYSSSISVSRPEKGTYFDVTGEKMTVNKGKIYSGSTSKIFIEDIHYFTLKNCEV